MTEEFEIVRDIDPKVWSEIFNGYRYSRPSSLVNETLSVSKENQSRVTRSKPIKIGDYSIDNDHHIVFDRPLVRYLNIPNTVYSMDLLEGYNTDVNWGKSPSNHIYKMSEWIDKGYRPQSQDVDDADGPLLDTDFFCGRTPLAYIMTFPYERYESLIITATKFRGNIYLFDYRKPQPPPDDEFNQIIFSGHRFEQYMTSDDPNRPNKSQAFNNDRTAYVGIVKTKLTDNSSNNTHKIVTSCEIDCLTRDARPESVTVDQFVEIKVTNALKPFKQLKWWAQSYIVGVPTIHVGYRDDNFRVNQLKCISVDSLHTYRSFWSPEVCLNFLHRFLSFVKQIVTEDNPDVVYRFEFRPEIGVTYTKLEEPGDFRILHEKFIEKYTN